MATEADQAGGGRFAFAGDHLSSDLRVWLVTFVLVSGIGSAWALASPVYSGPDEPAHAIRAYSVAHGELLGDEPTDGQTLGLVVQAPVLLRATDPGCFATKPMVTAECSLVVPDTTVEEVGTLAGRHPPLYYGLVGLPSWLTVSAKGIYLMRLASILLSAAVLASAMVTARRPRWRTVMPMGLVVALTPMSFYLFGLINPNGLEIAASAGLWVNGLALAGEDDIDRKVVRRLIVAAVLVALVRQLGPLWLVLIVGTVAVLAGWQRLRTLLAARRLQIGLAIAALATAIQLVWLVAAKTLDDSVTGAEPVRAGTEDIVRFEVGQAYIWFREYVGLFGWLDTRAPQITYFVWGAIGIALLLAGLHVARRRTAWVLIGLVLAVLVLPPALEYPSVEKANFFWQGRYGLPLIIGVPLVAAWAMSRARNRIELTRSPAVLLAGVLLGVAQFLAFAQALRRYTVGADGTTWFFTQPSWTPPVPMLVLLVAFAVLIAGWIWWCRPRTEAADRGPSAPNDRRAALVL